MITLNLSNTDALTILRSGRLTDEVRSNLHDAILASMVEKTGLVEARVVRVGDMNHKIHVIKMARHAVSDSHPGRFMGLHAAKNWAEGVQPNFDTDRVILTEHVGEQFVSYVGDCGWIVQLVPWKKSSPFYPTL